MIRYIDEHRPRFGVEPICRVLAVAPSSYYAARSRPPSARAVSDETLKVDIGRIHAAHFGVYGARKLWRQLRREGIAVGRDRVVRQPRTGRAGDSQMGGVVERRPAARRVRRCPAGRVRGRILATSGGAYRRCLKPTP